MHSELIGKSASPIKRANSVERQVATTIADQSSLSMSLVKEEDVSFYKENGFVHIDNFLTPEEVTSLKNDIENVIRSAKRPDIVRAHVQMMGTKYHLDSVGSAELFFEKQCVSEEGELTEPLAASVHKIAHGVHVVCEGAKSVTFSDKMCDAVRKLTGYSHPVLVQGMFLLKQPRYGESSPCHVDETYVMSEPQGYVTGVWIALDDSLEHNGCLEFLPGSHKTHKLNKRWIRKRVKGHEAGHEDESIMKFVDAGNTVDQIVKDEDFVKVEVKSGGLVLINGLVLHKSNPNHSDDPRAAYTFHFYEEDGDRIRWSPLNWAQELPNYKFPSLY